SFSLIFEVFKGRFSILVIGVMLLEAPHPDKTNTESSEREDSFSIFIFKKNLISISLPKVH
ncbi:MAG: hypothetical protein DI548_14880, partial [Flavobacterium johnsoniae]